MQPNHDDADLHLQTWMLLIKDYEIRKAVIILFHIYRKKLHVCVRGWWFKHA